MCRKIRIQRERGDCCRLQRLPASVAMEEPWSLWFCGVLVLRNRLAFSGHALCSWLIWFSHRPFSRNEEKKPIFSSPLTKSTSRPLYHTSGVERVDLQIRSSCKVRCAVACCKQQNACCVFCTLWMMCDPATVCVVFFSLLSSEEWHFHLSNWAEPSARQAG